LPLSINICLKTVHLRDVLQMELDKIIGYFQGIFPALHQQDIDALLAITKIKTIEKDAFFIKAGEYKPVIAIVLKGIIRAYYITDTGQEMTPFFWDENLVTGSWETLYLKQPSALNYEAIETTSLAIVDFIAFKQLAVQTPTLQKVYIEMVEIILTNTLLHQQSYINEKPEKRYELFKQQSPHLLQRISQKHMASHLGITPISFSRMKKRLGS
jgi:CRP-like cAMP-binding protein